MRRRQLVLDHVGHQDRKMGPRGGTRELLLRDRYGGEFLQVRLDLYFDRRKGQGLQLAEVWLLLGRRERSRSGGRGRGGGTTAESQDGRLPDGGQRR